VSKEGVHGVAARQRRIRETGTVGILVVQRPLRQAGIFRDLQVIVDGKKVGDLRPKQYISLELSDGRYTVRGRMDWTTCRPLDVIVSGTEPAFVELSLLFASFVKWLILPTRAVKARLVKGWPDGNSLP
jgi:hypothetical protein